MASFAKPALMVPAFCLCLIFLIPAKSQAAGLIHYLAQRPAAGLGLESSPAESRAKTAQTSRGLGFNPGAAYGLRLLPWLRGEVESGFPRPSSEMRESQSASAKLDGRGAEQNTCNMLNLLAEARNGSKVTPFLGLGLGVSRAALSRASVQDPGSGQSGSDIALSYQAMLGVQWNAASHWGLELRGRYLGSGPGQALQQANAWSDSPDPDQGDAWVMDLGLKFSF